MTTAIPVTVDSRLRIPRRLLPPGLLAELKRLFTHPNPEYSKKRAMGFATWGVPTKLETWRIEDDQGPLSTFSLPRGGTKRLRVAAHNAGVTLKFSDARCTLPEVDMPRYRIPLDDGTEGALRPYQSDAIEKLMATENCLLRAPTGSGKTSIAIALVAQVRQPALVILWSANLLDQWIARLRKELGMREYQIGIIRGGKRRVTNITVAMQQTLWAMGSDEVADLAGNFGLVLVDEVQRAAARTIREVVDVFPARYRLGISADESRKDRLECLTRDLFGEVACDIPQEELVEEGAIHDVEIRVVPTAFEAQWYRDAENGSEKDWNRLLEEIQADDARNKLAIKFITGELKKGETVLAFCHRREHARWLADDVFAGTGCGLLLGGAESAVRFANDRHRLLSGAIKVAVGTVQAIGQGLDLPSVSRGVAVTPLGSNKQQFGQVRGRICRTSDGKKDAVMYVLWDQHVFPDHLSNFARWNKTVRVLQGSTWVDPKRYKAPVD